MFIIMIVVFILGYTAIALEHPLRIDKAASALLTGVILWVLFVFGADNLVDLANMASAKWNAFFHYVEDAGMTKIFEEHLHDGTIETNFYNAHVKSYFVTHYELLHHLGEIAEILFFLLGAMTIVEIVDQHEGFKVITDKIKTIVIPTWTIPSYHRAYGMLDMRNHLGITNLLMRMNLRLADNLENKSNFYLFNSERWHAYAGKNHSTQNSGTWGKSPSVTKFL